MIQIPANAQVVQTDDGMIIIVHPDGTIQVHGHQEGQTIPLDAIRALLGLEGIQAPPQAIVTLDDGSIVMDAGLANVAATGIVDASSQAVFDLSNAGEVPLVDQTSSVIAIDANGDLTVNGIPALMAYDPVTGQTVALDPTTGQPLALDPGLLTVDGGQTLVAVDGGGHAIVTMDCGSNQYETTSGQ